MVLLGLGAAGLSAVAGNRAWATVEGDQVLVTGDDAGKLPLAGALALVVLAAWGVLLVTRRTVRRLVAVLGLLAALGQAAVVVAGWSQAPRDLRRAVADLAYAQDASVDRSVWYWTAALAAIVCVATTAAAVRLVASWPEMGSRYDAPGGGALAREQTSVDLWKALDDGRDPTVDPVTDRAGRERPTGPGTADP